MAVTQWADRVKVTLTTLWMVAAASCSAPAADQFSSEIFPVIAIPARAGGAGFLSATPACEPILPAAACPVGSMAMLGSHDCKAVGSGPCVDGFVKASGGWGCSPILPTGPCTGATFERLGSATCQPIGDCAAAFPTAAATLFVDPTGPVDATHFRTVSEAVIAAPATATIAVAAGSYAETVTVTRPLTIAGRCAQMVELRGSGPAVAGIKVNAGGALTLSGMTLTNHLAGLWVASGGSAVPISLCTRAWSPRPAARTSARRVFRRRTGPGSRSRTAR